MKVKKIQRSLLTKNLLPDIIIERTFYNLPKVLQQLYREKKSQGLQLSIGLDTDLGFYLLKKDSFHSVELLWWENRFFARKVSVA
ncbi:MAG TPA: hypothetical protein DCS93_22140 [Microscillaceae bacterium]|nr:hypothetical protein [Microscillaceae bacterium]